MPEQRLIKKTDKYINSEFRKKKKNFIPHIAGQRICKEDNKKIIPPQAGLILENIVSLGFKAQRKNLFGF